MGYNDSINELKAALSKYSDEESKLYSLYDTALKNAEKAYELAQKQSDLQYDRDRNEIYADTAREEKNAFNLLASRGLGFSGEAAQTKLNSGITLANRLGELTHERNKNAFELERDHIDRTTNLSIENADKIGALNQKRNDILADIAGMELDKEQHDAKLYTDKKMQEEKLNHDREMQKAELEAKYGDTNISVNGNGGGGNSNGSGKEESDKQPSGFLPEISPKDLAKQVISSVTGEAGVVSTDKHEYQINKYLLKLIDEYDMNDEYYEELVFMLRAYGYNVPEEIDMRADVISTEAEQYYKSRYDKLYNEYVVNGSSDKSARESARIDATNDMLKYIFELSKNEKEFRYFCAAADFTKKQIDEYLNIHEFEPVYNSIPGGAGKVNTVVTQMTK